MNYYSLNGQSTNVTFKEAALRGLAPDKGLYFPTHVPFYDGEFFEAIGTMDDVDLAFHIIKPYVGDDIPNDILRKIVHETLGFATPLVQVTETIYSLELFHGPTLAFKDVGARFMSRCLGYFNSQLKERPRRVVLVATSGDTGGAVANGFYNVGGVEVVILYPSGKVSSVQEKQLTTLGNNIHALEVNGNFDECQRLVKDAFSDEEVNKVMSLTSANSINVARWLPQQFYYFMAWKQWPEKNHSPVIAVPSGNFGNICAGILAHASGLPVRHFIAACNANDTIPVFLETGRYEAGKTIPTISNAMDVNDPNNFVRILEIFEKDVKGLKRDLSAVSIGDEETRATIKRVYKNSKYLLDPHGAVAYLSLERYLAQNEGAKGLFVETAHPVKFYDVVEPIIEEKIPLPPVVRDIMTKFKVATKIEADYDSLKHFLLTM